MARLRKRTKMLYMLLKEIGPDINKPMGIAFENVMRHFCKNSSIITRMKNREQLYKDYDSLVETLTDHNICFHPMFKISKNPDK